MNRGWLLIPCLAGCEIEQSDIDTDDPDDLPDITGTYQVAPLSEVVGCEGNVDVDLTWVAGEMVVSGPATALGADWASGAALQGSIDLAFTFALQGTVASGPLDLVVEVEGLAFLGDAGWKLDADLAADAVDSTAGATACMLTGRLEAEQESP